MSARTPGPWGRGGQRQITSPIGVICEVWSGPSGIEAADANERAIAMVPDLLLFIGRIASGEVSNTLGDEARALIAKADNE